MKLTEFNSLISSVEKYGVELNPSKPLEFKKQIETFEKEGLESQDLSELFNTNSGEFLTLLKDGSVRKCMVHIVDITNYRRNYNLPRFHIYRCKTIEGMERKKEILSI